MSEALRKAAANALEFLLDGNFPYPTSLRTDLEAALAEPEQSEPVAWAATSKYVVGGVAEVHLSFNKPQGDWFASVMPLFAAPPRREPLTKDEITALWNQTFGTGKGFGPFARAIETAHGITGGKE
jgi:hypothetical protein